MIVKQLHAKNRNRGTMLTMIEVNRTAPDFTLRGRDGDVTLSSFRGKKVILYFYPKDNTPGCTKEACSFRDNLPKIEEKNAVVIGISPDGSDSHERFAGKYNLPFMLLSDPEHKVMSEYGAYGEKTMYGKKTIGVIRSTFLIGEDGTVLRVWKKVNTATHGEDVYKAL